MNKEANELKDKMIEEFIRYMESFKSSHQSRQEEWEILEFTGKDGEILSKSDPGVYRNDMYARILTLDYAIAINMPTRKVRRLSDSSVLEVGKGFNIDGREVIITELDGKRVGFKPVDGSYAGGGMNLSDIISITEVKHNPEMWVVFTEDGFGQYTWCAEKWKGSREQSNFDETVKDFKTEEEAWQFVHDHQPRLSLAMIREAFSLTGISWDIKNIMNHLEEGLSKRKNQ